MTRRLTVPRRLAPALLAIALALPACSQKARVPRVAPVEPDATASFELPGEEPRHEPGITHAVKSGETWTAIAEDYYGDPERARGLRRANPDNAQEPTPGQTIFIPFTERERTAYAERAEARAPYNRGLELARAGQYPDAILEFEAALAHDPRLARAHYNLGLVYQRAGQPRRAVSSLEKASELAPSADYRYAFGLALHEVGEMGRAERAFRSALELDPGHLASLYALARALAERESGEADRYWRAVLARDPDGPRGREGAAALGLAAEPDPQPEP
jgi:tetratricopeptide (TPR) repeat protein